MQILAQCMHNGNIAILYSSYICNRLLSVNKGNILWKIVKGQGHNNLHINCAVYIFGKIRDIAGMLTKYVT
jgi:hypothetical protein